MEPRSVPIGERVGDAGRPLPEITVLAGGQRIRIAGDVDMQAHEQLCGALAALPHSGPVLHLELADLRFIDVAGTRALMTFALSQPRRRVILHDPPRTLRRLLSMLWPGAEVEIRDSVPPGAAMRIVDNTQPAGWRPGWDTIPAARARSQAGAVN